MRKNIAESNSIDLNNYEIENVVPFDMFPNTKSVETLVKLKLKEIK